MVSRQDIESKVREIETIIGETKENAQQAAVVTVVGGAALLAAAFLLGRRRGKSRGAVVEVYEV